MQAATYYGTKEAFEYGSNKLAEAGVSEDTQRYIGVAVTVVSVVLMAKAATNASAPKTTKRQASKTLRKKWEKEHGEPWPKEPANPARNQSVKHKEPLADGGTNDVGNIAPQPWSEHMQEHVDNGDYSRWGKRRKN